MPDVDPENIRLTIAKQGSVEQSVALLLRAFCTAVREAVDKPNPEHLVQIARHIDDNPKAWTDAVFANTPQAEQTIGISLVSLPAEVRDAFAAHGSQKEAQSEEGRQGHQQQDQRPPQQPPQMQSRPQPQQQQPPPPPQQQRPPQQSPYQQDQTKK